MSIRVNVAEKYDVEFDEMDATSADEFLDDVNLIQEHYDAEFIMWKDERDTVFELNPNVLQRLLDEDNGMVSGKDLTGFIGRLLDIYDKDNDFIRVELF